MYVVLKWYKKYHGTRDLYLEFFDLSNILTMGMINL